MYLHYGALNLQLSHLRLIVAIFTNVLLHANVTHLLTNCALFYVAACFMQMIPIKPLRQYFIFGIGCIGSSLIWLVYQYLIKGNDILVGISGGVICMLTYTTVIYVILILKGITSINDIVYNHYGHFQYKFFAILIILLMQLIGMYLSDTTGQLVVHYSGALIGLIYAIISFDKNFV